MDAKRTANSPQPRPPATPEQTAALLAEYWRQGGRDADVIRAAQKKLGVGVTGSMDSATRAAAARYGATIA
jgi:hypothetical protein